MQIRVDTWPIENVESTLNIYLTGIIPNGIIKESWETLDFNEIHSKATFSIKSVIVPIILQSSIAIQWTIKD